jgi:folate-binding protein YgfZ
MTQAAPSVATSNEETYRAAIENVVRLDTSARGCVRLTGRDRAALLQRLTTNDLVRLNAGAGARTVLINSHARILDLLMVYALPEHLLVITSPGQGGALVRYLQNRIFFQDKVTVEDLSNDTIQLDLYGPQAAVLIQQATSVDPQEWPLHHIQAASIDSAQVWIARTLPIGGAGFTILAQRGDADLVHQAFASAQQLDADTFDVLRIEHGYPAPKRELSTEYIPLETGLNDAISFTKGCYVGQEIIARMESRNRLAKRLMGLRLSQVVASGVELRDAEKAAGAITSVALSPRYGPIGLAYIRTAAATPGTQLQIADGATAELIELPFGQ